MQLACTCDHMLPIDAFMLHQLIRPAQLFQALNEFDQVAGIHRRHTVANDGTHGELHRPDAVGKRIGCDCASLLQVFVYAGDGDDVAGVDEIEGDGLAADHGEAAADVFDEEVSVVVGRVVGAEDADLEAGAQAATEHAAECEEFAFVVLVGKHFAYVDHESGVGVAGAYGLGRLVVLGAFGGFRNENVEKLNDSN